MTAARHAPQEHSWFSPLALDSQPPRALRHFAFARLWHGFMTARVMIALVLLALQGSIYILGRAVPLWLIGLCIAYLAVTLAVRLLARPKPPGQTFDPQWVTTIGIDVLAFSALQFLQAGGINYTPLFALPVLLAAVLGSVSLALATAAAVTLLLLADAWWVSLLAPTDVTSRFMQAGLTGSGLFIVAFLTNQLAARLARAEVKARRNRVEAHVQTLVNELVIDGLDDGILVIDHRNVVRAANPAARALVGRGQPARHAPFTLGSEPGWAPLADLAQFTLTLGEPQFADLTIQHVGQPRCHIHARTQLTASLSEHAESLCVMFLQDLREMEARLRTEKLAAMGRMSAAVAHEIRNPLAAIAQANALLDEDLTHPSHKQLTQMVRQNTQRLAQIVEDVLDIARVQHQHNGLPPATMELHAAVQACCDDWMRQTGCTLPRVRLALQKGTQHVVFDADHLRRVLINLLDNALRYASTSAGAIQVTTQGVASGPVSLSVWSDGAPLEQTVQRHLFEPFFSSESRSSGLGLYICRELCERHGAVIGYDRALRDQAGRRVEGNEFHVSFQPAAGVPARAPVAAPSTSS